MRNNKSSVDLQNDISYGVFAFVIHTRRPRDRRPIFGIVNPIGTKKSHIYIFSYMYNNNINVISLAGLIYGTKHEFDARPSVTQSLREFIEPYHRVRAT
mgnify:CR=1 FL=1